MGRVFPMPLWRGFQQENKENIYYAYNMLISMLLWSILLHNRTKVIWLVNSTISKNGFIGNFILATKKIFIYICGSYLDVFYILGPSKAMELWHCNFTTMLEWQLKDSDEDFEKMMNCQSLQELSNKALVAPIRGGGSTMGHKFVPRNQVAGH